MMKKLFLAMILFASFGLGALVVKAQQTDNENPLFNTLLNRIDSPAINKSFEFDAFPTTKYNTGRDDVQITILVNEHAFPYYMSTDGQYVLVSGFGGGGAFWSEATGLIPLGDATGNGISDSGVIAGYFENPDVTWNGDPVQCAGTWSPVTQNWEFLGMNPAASLFSNDYSSGWGISADNNIVAGMQYISYTDYKAFKWTLEGGYDMIGNLHSEGSRASGVSADGSKIYGWAQTSFPRTPAIWYNNQIIFIDNTQGGEAFGASADGNYVTGTLGSLGFLWSADSPLVTFPNSINTGAMSPTCVTNDGTIYGFNNTAWPPVPWGRRAFIRDNQGNMTTFNDYAESRGLPNAQAWTFYSINHATPDGNKVIGAGITPEGQDVSFLIEFSGSSPALPGDANCDGSVDILDAITISNYILGHNPQPFCFENADINGDGEINLHDIIGTINLILN